MRDGHRKAEEIRLQIKYCMTEDTHTLEPGNPLYGIPGYGASDGDRVTGQDGHVADRLNERRSHDEDLLRVEDGPCFVPGLTAIDTAILLTDGTDVHVADDVSVYAVHQSFQKKG